MQSITFRCGSTNQSAQLPGLPPHLGTTREQKDIWTRALKRIKAHTFAAATANEAQVASITSVCAIRICVTFTDKVVALAIAKGHRLLAGRLSAHAVSVWNKRSSRVRAGAVVGARDGDAAIRTARQLGGVLDPGRQQAGRRGKVVKRGQHGKRAAAGAQAQDGRRAGGPVEARAGVGAKVAVAVVRVQVLLEVAAAARVEAPRLGQRALEALPQLHVVHDRVVDLVKPVATGGGGAVANLAVELLLEGRRVEQVLGVGVEQRDDAGDVGAAAVERVVQQKVDGVALHGRHAALHAGAGALPRAAKHPRPVAAAARRADGDALLVVEAQLWVLPNGWPDGLVALVPEEERLRKGLLRGQQRRGAPRAHLEGQLRELHVHVVDEVGHGQVAVAGGKVDARRVQPHRVVARVKDGDGGRIRDVNEVRPLGGVADGHVEGRDAVAVKADRADVRVRQREVAMPNVLILQDGDERRAVDSFRAVVACLRGRRRPAQDAGKVGGGKRRWRGCWRCSGRHLCRSGGVPRESSHRERCRRCRRGSVQHLARRGVYGKSSSGSDSRRRRHWGCSIGHWDRCCVSR